MSSSNSSWKKPGLTVKEIFPQVISASRATDIPAFYAEWFMNRLKQGFCEWQNPFNANQRQIVNFSRTRAIVFWSKNPTPLFPYLDDISRLGIKFYFQFTINDYESAGLEPGIPPLGQRLEIFAQLAEKYRVIWRYDPILVGDRLSIKYHLARISDIMKKIGSFTPKLVFSFVDLYGRVGTSLKHFNPEYRAPNMEEIHNFALQLVNLRDTLAPGLKLATCAETDLDIQKLGIEKNSCIDPELINEICGEEIYPFRNNLLGKVFEKDKGQRDACGCAPSKDIGSYRFHPCNHHCIYCYAGHAKR